MVLFLYIHPYKVTKCACNQRRITLFCWSTWLFILFFRFTAFIFSIAEWLYTLKTDRSLAFNQPTKVYIIFILIYYIVLIQNFFGFWYCSSFVFIWQTLYNHGVTRLKRFVSRFTYKLCNYFLFSFILMLYVCAVKFDVTDNLSWKIFGFWVN